MKQDQRVLSRHDVLYVPVDVFADRTLSVLEVMVRWLREEQGLSYHEIAVLLNRNDRTIWTVYSRVKGKVVTDDGRQSPGARNISQNISEVKE